MPVFEWMLLPRMALPTFPAVTTTPAPALCAIRFASPASVPPTTLLADSSLIPGPPLPRAPVPSAVVPILLPRMIVPVAADGARMPGYPAALALMTLSMTSSPGPASRMPYWPLAIEAVPAALVPM